MNYWMVPLVILVAVGFTALGFAPLLAGMVVNSIKKKKLRLHGQRATVEILGIRDTRVTVNLNPQVELSVRMPDGSVGKFKMFVSRVNFPRPGETIEVLYDPTDPSVVMPA
jgi:hypothetical protein